MNQAAAQPGGGNGKAVAIGIGAMIIGALVWAMITAATKHEFSAVAIGVGALIGLSMFATRPTSGGIAAVAAVLTFIGCALGELLALPMYAIFHGSADKAPTVFRYELQHLGDFFGELGGKSYLFWVIGAVAAFSITFRRIQAARVMAQQAGAYGAAPAGAPFGTAQPYGAAAPGQAPYPPQPQAPYGQQPPQPGHGPGSQPGPNPPAGPDPYGQNPGQPPYGQQYPPG